MDKLKKRYGSLFGALLHAIKWRPEISAALGLCGTCLTIYTEELYANLERVLVYLARTKKIGTTFSADTDSAKKLRAYADANWTTTRSTTGFVIMLAGGAIAHASRRQHCISMSTCETELIAIALADCAIKLLYITGLLRFLGHEIDEAIEVYTDNKAADDLCHRFNSAQNSRHIDRNLFNMRELRGLSVVTVAHVPTAEDPADLFTKRSSPSSLSTSTASSCTTSRATLALTTRAVPSRSSGARRPKLRRGTISNSSSSSSRTELTRRWAYSLARAPWGRR